MNNLLILLAISGIIFAIQELDGPFDIILKFRTLLSKIPFVQHFFVYVMTCSFCAGFWMSSLVYIIINMHNIHICELLIWAFGGAAFNMLFSNIISKS